ncbi:unnamed protein product [Mycena citricolor]|uniref:Uncharacterized protein n=1 Tax=Mycena citricolor TaxID=2018698 RepID=A0AAD2Q2H8_9AGAR|nr:unnamed protein product [Mycena citricolor]
MNTRYPHPFHEDPEDGETESAGVPDPTTLAELRMCKLSAQLREKDRWWDKCWDENITRKWTAEVQEQQKDLVRWSKLSERMVNYVIEELQAASRIREKTGGVEPGPFDRVYISDGLIAEELTAQLAAAVKLLEDVPSNEKDWHPGSEERVLDLVHPSICPLVYDDSWGRSDEGVLQRFAVPALESDDVDAVFVSPRFQWLPSDFAVDDAGAVKLVSPYMNNIPSQHQDAFVPVLERIMERALPLWEGVLTELRTPPQPRIDHAAECVMGSGYTEDIPSDDELTAELAKRETELEPFRDWTYRYLLRGDLNLPEAPEQYVARRGDVEAADRVSLRGSTIQVIVKLANIVLTPENPSYPGGIWHVEGMANESIVSTFIYYYDTDNIEPSSLSFRQATSQPEYHEQDDAACMTILYGIDAQEPCVQVLGEVQTKAGRCIAFPNIYQHLVSPFSLVDTTKPGTRKILVFFLVDPTRRIVSATNVPPQQVWEMKRLLRAQGPQSRLSTLPLELVEYIATLVPGVKTRQEANEIREELMGERTIVVESVDREYFSRSFNMCEH